ncbi:MAG: IS1380 family transposase [Gordonia sp. (in: high G+C Gram-positive bacteria)]
MSKSTSRYPSLSVEGGGTGIVSHAGAAVLLRAGEKTGLLGQLSRALERWRKPLAIHDPGKIVFDLAVSVAIGGDCLADIAQLRGYQDVFGPVASDPTVSRLITALAADAGAALVAINTARAAARSHAWEAADADAPDAACDQGGVLVVDLDASLLTAHSEKESAAPTYKRGFGFHPLCAFVDHGPDGTGEPVAMMLRPGNAGANTAADHITVAEQVLAQVRTPATHVLIRTDSGGGTHEFVNFLTDRGLGYSVGFGLTQTAAQAIDRLRPEVWTPAYDPDGTEREGAWVAELTGMLDLSSWPVRMRVIVRKERPHPGAQLRFTDRDGLRLTAFATNTRSGQLASLELRHRRRACCEDRIRTAKDCGLRNLPLHGFDQNRIWCVVVELACELLAWTQMIALHGSPARRWEPKALRLRLFSVAARLTCHAQRRRLQLAARAPCLHLLLDAMHTLAALPDPG